MKKTQILIVSLVLIMIAAATPMAFAEGGGTNLAEGFFQVLTTLIVLPFEILRTMVSEVV